MIPRILHQSWKQADIPTQWRGLQQNWIRHHPDWEYRFWTDADNHALVAEHYPSLLALYDAFPLDINRAELARYLVVRHFGGVYVDMAFECLRPIGPLLSDRPAVFGLEPASHCARAAIHQPVLGRLVCNAFLASIPNHPFWPHMLDHLATCATLPDVLLSTGTVMFTQAMNSYAGGVEIAVEAADTLYPIDIEQAKKAAPEHIAALTADAYAVHHWSGSWWRDAVLRKARDRIARTRA
jgi:mannosyltransferase OCH1-like enzyme